MNVPKGAGLLASWTTRARVGERERRVRSDRARGIVSVRGKALYGLVFLAAFMSLGHHLDHVIRGNHVGWPLTEHPTPFTYSLAVYPLIVVGLFLYRSGKAGPGFWAFLSGSGALFVAAVHFGPFAVEPPADIVGPYESPVVGHFAFAWLVVFVAVLVFTFFHEVRLWHLRRREDRAHR